jgi:hypothetical protein
MRTSPHAITGRRVLALVVCALALGAISVELDAATASQTSGSAPGASAAATSAAR